MSFLLDPPLLVASGAAIEATSQDPKSARRKRMALTATFIAGAAGLWANSPLVKFIYKPFGSRSGREFMATSGFASAPESELSRTRSHATAIALLAMYPFWAWLGGAALRSLRSDTR